MWYIKGLKVPEQFDMFECCIKAKNDGHIKHSYVNN